MTNGNEPAFPQEKWGNQEIKMPGLTKREYFAGLAMQGELASQSIETGEYSTTASYTMLAKRACAIADALLAELERNDETK